MPLRITEKKKEMLSLTGLSTTLGKRYSFAERTEFKALHSGFLYQSIHHVPTENQVLYI